MFLGGGRPSIKTVRYVRQSLVDDSLRDSSGGVDEFESNYSSQTMLTAGPGLEARSGPKGGRSVQYTSLDEAPVGSEDGSRLKLPLIAKPAWASASSKRLVPLEGSGEGQLASIASPSNLVVKQRAAIPLVDPDAPAPRNQIHSSGESASDEDSDGE